MPDSTDSLTRLLQWLGGIIVGAGGFLGWANYRLAKARQPVALRLDEAQIEVHQANAHKITVEGLISSAGLLRDERDYWKADSAYWRERAEKAERHLLVEELDKLQPPPSDGKGS
jgi:hypothetical protein